MFVCIFVWLFFLHFCFSRIYECHLVPTFLPLRSISQWGEKSTTCALGRHHLFQPSTNQWEASKTDQSHPSVSAPTYCYISSSLCVLSLLRKNLMSFDLFNLACLGETAHLFTHLFVSNKDTRRCTFALWIPWLYFYTCMRICHFKETFWDRKELIC